MRSISINIINDESTILGTLDVGDGDINLIYQFSDIRDPEKRKTNYIRKFKLPGTKNNNRLFNSFHELGYHISDVFAYSFGLSGTAAGSGKSFDPNRKLIAQVILEDNIFFEGLLQLNKVNNEDGAIEYEVTIYGNLSDFFINIGDLNLSDLDISEYNHPMTMENIVKSQYFDDGNNKKELVVKTKSGYSYEKDFNNSIQKNGKEHLNYLGEGYVYPLIYTGGTDFKTSVHIEKWSPAVYVYTIWKKIFEKAGFRFKSEFLESELFKRLILPFSKDSLQVSQDTVDKSGFLANVGNTDAPTSDTLYKYIDTFTSVFGQVQTSTGIQFDKRTPGSTLAIPDPRDPGSTFNGIEWTAPKDGKFRLQTSLQLTLRFQPLTSPLIWGLKVNNSSGANANAIPITVKFINSSTKAVIAQKAGEIIVVNGVYVTEQYFTAPLFLDWEGQLSAGTKVQVILEQTNLPQVGSVASMTTNNLGTPINVRQQIFVRGSLTDSSNFSATLTDYSVNNGDIIDMNKVLPDTSAKDFLTGINRMFNLYWVPTGKDREFSIEPKDDIFDAVKDKIYDWTDIINNEENVSIEPLFNLTGNKYKFSYTEDSDYLNKTYLDKNFAIYGELEKVIDNDFQDDNPEIKTSFSPTPLYSPSFNAGISLSAIFSENGTKFKRYTPKPRILYWGGYKPIIDSKDIPAYQNGVTIEKYDPLGKSLGGIVYSTFKPNNVFYNFFPYAGHLDDPINPQIDLNFGLCAEYYHNYSSLTNNNLYNRYWRSTAEEIFNPSQHLLTANIYLSSSDMSNLDLRSTIQVNFIYYRINKITYNPITEEAEVELFKTFDYKTFTPSTLAAASATIDIPLGKTLNSGGAGSTFNGSSIDNNWGTSRIVNINGASWFKTLSWKATLPQNDALSRESSAYQNSRIESAGIGFTIPARTSKPGDEYDNIYPKGGAVSVNGKWNNVAATAQFVAINGSYNTVADAAQNINIAGNYNMILPGISNVTVIGDNQVIRKSNMAYIDGSEIGRGGIDTSANVTIVKSPESIWIESGVLSGPKNSVGTFVGRKAPIINANAPIPIPKNAPIQAPNIPLWEVLTIPTL